MYSPDLWRMHYARVELALFVLPLAGLSKDVSRIIARRLMLLPVDLRGNIRYLGSDEPYTFVVEIKRYRDVDELYPSSVFWEARHKYIMPCCPICLRYSGNKGCEKGHQSKLRVFHQLKPWKRYDYAVNQDHCPRVQYLVTGVRTDKECYITGRNKVVEWIL